VRAGGVLSIVLLDLDDFKSVNDERGHAFGDALLRWVVTTMSDVVRPSDAIGRLGGDEFAILAPGAGSAEATGLAERLHAALGERTPVSFGVSTYRRTGSIATACTSTPTSPSTRSSTAAAPRPAGPARAS
jgi:diguanylate cyclase (GGDEF)-like protein